METEVLEVYKNFVNEMNKWEKNCEEKGIMKIDVSDTNVLKEIFNKYLTTKKRSYGRENAIFWSSPPSYDINDKIEKVELLSNSKVNLFIYQKGITDIELCYTLLKKGSNWLFDTKKRRILPDGKWENDFL